MFIRLATDGKESHNHLLFLLYLSQRTKNVNKLYPNAPLKAF